MIIIFEDPANSFGRGTVVATAFVWRYGDTEHEDEDDDDDSDCDDDEYDTMAITVTKGAWKHSVCRALLGASMMMMMMMIVILIIIIITILR